jgi:uncharacterized protein (DUF2252 family)
MTSPSTPAERTASGAVIRGRVAPAVFGAWQPAADRPDPVALLEEQATTRIASLVPLRYGRMQASPFAFLRGAALPMAADLAPLPRTDLTVQLCGDAHLCNFGLFASPERSQVFDVNDFDETHPGSFEWDLMRLSASLVVAARSRGLDAHVARHVVHRAVRSYRLRMHEYAAMRAIDVYYARVDVAAVMAFVDQRARPYLKATIRAAAHHDALHELPKLTSPDGGSLRIVDRPPIIVHLPEITEPLAGETLARYRETLQEDRRVVLDRYRLIDTALKVVGVGSVGLPAHVALLMGGAPDDPLFLQVKTAEASVLSRFLGHVEGKHHGERVVLGQRRLQAVSDVLLGWTTGPFGRELYVRQLHDQKGSPVVEAMSGDDLTDWGELCAWTLARGHARSGDPAAIAGYLGDDNAMDHAMGDFAAAYADQTERDHAALREAIRTGRVKADVEA